MRNIKAILFVLIFMLIFANFTPPCFAVEDDILFEQARRKLMDFSYSDVKKSAGDEAITSYSGKMVIWQGELVRKIDNDAYFEYILKLANGDEFRVLSGTGIRFKVGDYVRVRGMILIKDGRFSHLVLDEMEAAVKPYKPVSVENIAGLIPLNASDKVISKRIYEWILYYNSGISAQNADYISNRIVYFSRRYKQDPFLVTALMSVESAFNMNAISPAGAIGLGQLMPGTASMLGVNPYLPEQNIEGSVRYLADQMELWKNSGMQVALALASYNAGPGAVIKYKGIPPYQETIDYVNIVSALYYKIRKK